MRGYPAHSGMRSLPPAPLSRVADGIANLLFPDSCFACSSSLTRRRDCGLCPACREKLCALRITPPLCPCCGLPYPSEAGEGNHLCSACVLRPPPFSSARSFGFYRGELSLAIQEFKFRGRRNLAGILAQGLAECFVSTWSMHEFDLIVPVPLHRRRERERGFNQSALLARSLAPLVGIAWEGRGLVRIRDTAPQVGLSDFARAGNVSGAFLRRSSRSFEGKSVLLLDDVMTTGATAASAAATLRKAGSRRVCVLTVARAVPGAG